MSWLSKQVRSVVKKPLKAVANVTTLGQASALQKALGLARGGTAATVASPLVSSPVTSMPVPGKTSTTAPNVTTMPVLQGAYQNKIDGVVNNVANQMNPLSTQGTLQRKILDALASKYPNLASGKLGAKGGR